MKRERDWGEKSINWYSWKWTLLRCMTARGNKTGLAERAPDTCRNVRTLSLRDVYRLSVVISGKHLNHRSVHWTSHVNTGFSLVDLNHYHDVQSKSGKTSWLVLPWRFWGFVKFWSFIEMFWSQREDLSLSKQEGPSYTHSYNEYLEIGFYCVLKMFSMTPG